MSDTSPSTSPQLPIGAAARRSDIYFLTDDLRHGLGRRTARGGAYTLGTTAVNFVVTTTATILVTRHLTKEDFGLYGMVIVLTGFAGMFVDLGLSRAVVQKPQISRGQVSTLFWINLALASLIAVVVAALTPVLVWFYDEPRLVPINLAMSGLFIVGALGLQHRALLERRMEFGRLNIVAAIAPLIASAAAVALALLDYGYWALVAIPAVSQMVTVAGMWVMCRWTPGWPHRHTGVRTMLAFGGHVTGTQFITYFARNADNVMLGYAWGAGSLGLYTRAYSLMMLPLTKVNLPLRQVAVPALSRLTDRPDEFRKAFFLIIETTLSLNCALVSLACLLAPEAIPLLLGRHWDGVTPLFVMLTPAGVAASMTMASGWLYLSWGHIERQLRWTITTTPLVVIGFAVGLQFGAEGIALAVGSLYAFLQPLSLMWATKSTPIRALNCLKRIGRIITRYLLAIILTYAFLMLAGVWIDAFPKRLENVYQSDASTPATLALVAMFKIVIYCTICTPHLLVIITRLRQVLAIGQSKIMP